ncbi:hypothetical protein C7D73_21755, partial [Klebsiella pneumoniae]
SNTGSQPLWLRLDSSGYPQSAPQPGGNVLGIERHYFSIPQGQQKSLSSLEPAGRRQSANPATSTAIGWRRCR